MQLWTLGLDDALKVTTTTFPTLAPQVVQDRLASMLVYMQEGDRLTVAYVGTTAVFRKQLNDIAVEKLERAAPPPATGNQGVGTAGPPSAALSTSATQAVAQAGLGLAPPSLPKHLALLLANLRDGDSITFGHGGTTATFRRQGEKIAIGDGTGAAPTPAPAPTPVPPAPTPAPLPVAVQPAATQTAPVTTAQTGAATGPAKVTIRKALYGPAGDAIRTKDVTVQVQRMVDAGTTAFLVADLATEGDPAYGTVKTLAVDYEAGGRGLQVTATDPELFAFQVPTPTRPVALDTDPATWPVAFEAVGSRGDPMLARTLLCPGYYAGLPEPMAAGLRINGGWTHTGLWLPEPVGTHGQLSLGFLPDANGWCLIVWPGGPGRGRVVDAGYNVIIRADGLEFRRDGAVVGTAKIDPPLAVGSDNTLTVTRNGGKITVDLSGKALLRYVDAQPLTGALTSRVGFGGAGYMVSDLKLRRPDLTAEELAAIRDVPLLPTATRQPTPNAEAIFQGPPADIKATWPQAQPHAIDVRGDGLVLFNWNGNPCQWYPTPVKGNVAFEVDFSFVPARWPAPVVSQAEPADFYMLNGYSEAAFTALLTYCDALPAPAEMLKCKPVFEWGVQIPNRDADVGIIQSRAGGWQALSRMPYVSLVPGHRYTARIERIGKRLRLFLDRAFVTEVGSPDVPDDNSPCFLGFGQWCSGNLVHAARAWQLP